MDNAFTEKVQAWLDTPAAERDNALGALYYLRLSNNKITYNNLMANPDKRADVIEYQIRKYMKFRLAQVTHDEVVGMMKQVERIAELRHLDSDTSTAQSTVVTTPLAPSEADGERGREKGASAGFASGKRADHDSLPAEIQALYVENASIMQKMRELHLQLRKLSLENATCPDSDRFPFLKELIKLDKQYHSNWHKYDSYNAETAAADAEQSLIEDARAKERSIYRQINLTKGRYKKALAAGKPTDTLKEQIAELYSQLASPVETLTAELKELGIIA